ncbi:MAG: HNH endonuclease signature motif containing protein [Novosphingobium sp.]|nr:HNH endonuclease signature motif containing protein [Novosphingobium sp.]
MLEQEGRCPACGEKLKADQIIDEHLNPLDSGGSNDLSNRALFCLGCAREKTIDDTAASMHGRRVRGEIGQKRRRELRRTKPWTQAGTFPTNRNGRWKKKMNGRVVRRSAKRRRLRKVVSYLGAGRPGAVSTSRAGGKR